MLKKEKILVCITIQSNSKRLIEKGAEIAKETEGKLHILHVEKGMSIFENPDAIKMLEELFEYGKELGGEVHFVSDENVAKRIVTFVKDMEINKIILGQTMSNIINKMLKKDVNSTVTNKAKDLDVLILERPKHIDTEKMVLIKDSYV